MHAPVARRPAASVAALRPLPARSLRTRARDGRGGRGARGGGRSLCTLVCDGSIGGSSRPAAATGKALTMGARWAALSREWDVGLMWSVSRREKREAEVASMVASALPGAWSRACGAWFIPCRSSTNTTATRDEQEPRRETERDTTLQGTTSS